MKNIKVIATAPIYDLSAISAEERALFFERIGANHFTPQQINIFIKMQNDLIKNELIRIKPDLPELLVRKLVQMSKYVVPIIKRIEITGGRTKKATELNKPLEGEKTSSKNTIRISFAPVRVRFDYLVPAITNGNTIDYVIPAGEEVEIFGLQISQTCKGFIAPNVMLGYFNYIEYALSCDCGTTTEAADITTASELFDFLIEINDNANDSYPLVFSKIRHDIMGNDGAGIGLFETIPQLQLPPPTEISRDNAKGKILDFLETLHKGRFLNINESVTFADITLRGLGPIYYNALLKGRDHKDVKAAADLLQEQVIRAKFQAELNRKKFVELTQLNVYKAIIEKKLGSKKLAEIIAGSPVYTAEELLKRLKPNERKPIELEYKQRVAYAESMLTNKCPHVKLYKGFRRQVGDRAKTSYIELKKYFVSGADAKSRGTSANHHNMVSCRVCHFDIMCPHVRDITEMENAGRSPGEIKAAMSKYTSPIKDQFFCNICGELVASLEAFDSPESRQILDEDLSNAIWGETASLMKYLKFGSFVNVSSFIGAIRDTIYPYIFEIEKQILKSKTNSADEIRSKRKLYITIYAFAYLTHLVLANSSKEISFAEISAKKATAVDVIKHIMQIIIVSRNTIIREIPGITPDIIKNVLIEAYKSMQSTGTKIITHSDATENLLEVLLIDPVYRYIYEINTIAKALAGRGVPEDTDDFVDSIDSYMGAPVSKLEKLTNLYSEVRVPKFDISSKTNDKSGKHTYIDRAEFTKHIEAGYLSFIQRLKIYKDPVYVGVGGESLEVQFRPDYEKQFVAARKLVGAEKSLFRSERILAAHNYKFMPAEKTRQWQDPNAKLGRIYDEDGNPHDFSILICSDEGSGATKDTVELTAKDIAKQTEAGEVFNKTIADRKCAICGILKSAASGLSEDKIRESLQAQRAVGNFFKYFENRCPENGLHADFTTTTPCSKCGITTEFLSKTTSKGAVEYYKKYKTVYNVKPEAEPIAEVVKMPAPDFPEYYAYAFNFNIVMRLADKLKINSRLLMAMAASERKEYDDIVSGKYIPVESEDRYDTRIFVLDTNIKNLITEYNQVRFYYNLSSPPVDIQSIIDTVDKSLVGELSKLLPDIYADYNEKFQYVQQTKKPREIVAFCIQTFCEKCLEIIENNDKNTAKLRSAFVEYFVKKILRNDEMVTKPGHFSWSLLYGDDTKDTADTNFADDAPDESDLTPEGDAETAPMSMDDFDVDVDPDDVNPDENDQDIKVGEELGLD